MSQSYHSTIPASVGDKPGATPSISVEKKAGLQALEPSSPEGSTRPVPNRARSATDAGAGASWLYPNDSFRSTAQPIRSGVRSGGPGSNASWNSFVPPRGPWNDARSASSAPIPPASQAGTSASWSATSGPKRLVMYDDLGLGESASQPQGLTAGTPINWHELMLSFKKDASEISVEDDNGKMNATFFYDKSGGPETKIPLTAQAQQMPPMGAPYQHGAPLHYTAATPSFPVEYRQMIQPYQYWMSGTGPVPPVDLHGRAETVRSSASVPVPANLSAMSTSAHSGFAGSAGPHTLNVEASTFVPGGTISAGGAINAAKHRMEKAPVHTNLPGRLPREQDAQSTSGESAISKTAPEADLLSDLKEDPKGKGKAPVLERDPSEENRIPARTIGGEVASVLLTAGSTGGAGSEVEGGNIVRIDSVKKPGKFLKRHARNEREKAERQARAAARKAQAEAAQSMNEGK